MPGAFRKGVNSSKLVLKDVATGSPEVTESCPRYHENSPTNVGLFSCTDSSWFCDRYFLKENIVVAGRCRRTKKRKRQRHFLFVRAEKGQSPLSCPRYFLAENSVVSPQLDDIRQSGFRPCKSPPDFLTPLPKGFILFTNDRIFLIFRGKL